MKNIFRIYKRDMKKLFTNYVAIIIILALSILPSLYAWFNIKASWDPYGSTNGIKVAIVNKDKGYRFNNMELKIGDEMVSELKKNNSIGWVFTNEIDASYGVSHGKYYASIVITEDFSKNLTSFLNKNPKKPELIYSVNEKSNAIAPKITDKGASTLQQTVSENFVKTVNGVIFENFNKIGVEVENQKPNLIKLISIVSDLNNNMENIEILVDKFYNGSLTLDQFIGKIQTNVPVMEETVESAIEVGNQSKKFIEEGKETIETVSPYIKESLEFARDTAVEASNLIDSILNSTSGNETAKILNTIETLLKATDSKIISIYEKIDKINNLVQNPTLNEVSAQLKDISTGIKSQISTVQELIVASEKGDELAQNTLMKLKNDINQVIEFINGKIDSFDNEFKPALTDVIEKLSTIADNSLKMLNDLNSDMPTITNLLSLADEGATLGSEKLKEFKDALPEIKESVSRVNDKISVLNDDEKINSLIELLKTNPDSAKTFISTPVELVQNSLYKIPNYGSAMSPFYTVLAIWVGTLILSSILTVEVHEFEGERPLKSYEKFFGKYLFFFTIAVTQGLIVAIGDKYLLGCYVVDVKLFIALAALTATVFSMIVYSLVSVLGNVGKALGVILLVLQVAASGGTFPIEVTPPFFQAINPYLPFTYAIGAMREAVAGAVVTNLRRDIIKLLVFFIVFLLIGVLLKKPLDKIVEKFNAKFKESGLSE